MSDVDLQALTRDAIGHVRVGAYHEALGCAVQIDHAHPGHPNVFLVRALVAEQRGDFSGAIELMEVIRPQVPDRHDCRLHLGRMLVRAERPEKALGELYGHEWPEHLRAEAIQWQLEALMRLDRLADARQVLAAAETLVNDQPILRLLQARLIQLDGRTAEALLAVEALLADESVPVGVRAQCCFERGWMCDELRDYEGAIAAARAGNELLPAKFDPERFRTRVDFLVDFFDAERFDRLPRSKISGELPVFLVGLPRSGTQLVEQIIDRHPRGAGGGSQRDLRNAAEAIQQRKDIPFPSCCDELTPHDVAVVGTDLLKRFSAQAFGPIRVTNRAPSMDQLLGLLPLVLPGAQVIFVRRDPRDLLVSIYRRQFNASRMPWAATLEHLVLVIQQHERLVDHWKETLPNPWHEIWYEDIVKDQESTTRELVDFLGLDWHDACLQPQESDRRFSSQIRDQINAPVHDGHVGHWRHYEAELGEFLAAVDPDA